MKSEKYAIYMNIQEMACFLTMMSRITEKRNRQLIDYKDTLYDVHNQIFELWNKQFEFRDRDEYDFKEKNK